MKRKLFSSTLLLIPFTFLTAQDENKVFWKGWAKCKYKSENLVAQIKAKMIRDMG